MNETKNYVILLKECLEKKLSVLEELRKIENVQSDFDKNTDEDEIENFLDKKSELLEKLDKLDDGFEVIYEKVNEEMKINKYEYKEEIQEMQRIIKSITDITIELRVNEERLKKSFDKYCREKKENVKNFKISKKTAVKYYKNMSNTHKDEQSYFVDRKR